MSRRRHRASIVIAAREAAMRLCAGAFVLSLATSSAVLADDKNYVMKIALATQNDSLQQFANDYAAAVQRDSGGRIKVEVYPGSQLGSTERQIEGVQFGAIQGVVVPPDFLVGIDKRFEVLAAPGIANSMAQGQRLAADPAVRKLMLALGSDKGLHGVALFLVNPSSIVARTPIRRLADFRGKKIRILASRFQSVAITRLGATPKQMTLGDVLPALQDNVIDGALGAVTVFATMPYVEAAKYVTETNQSGIFAVTEISKKWYDALPADLQQIIDKDAIAESVAINPWATDFYAKARQTWVSSGGELISLPPDDQSALLKIIASVGDEVSSTDPLLNVAYQIVTEAAQRNR
jgi:TRAP-type transport system periplasmic protein